MDQISKLRSFLEAGRSICPFAKTVQTTYIMISSAPRFDRDKLLRTSINFARTRTGSSLAIVTKDIANYDEFKLWAKLTFLEIMIEFALITHGDPIKEIEREIEKKAKPIVMNDTHPKHMFVSLFSQPMTSIAMSPLYPEGHPRHAPVPCLIITWGFDVGAAQLKYPAAVELIRKTMNDTHGSVYDADWLVLPLPNLHKE